MEESHEHAAYFDDMYKRYKKSTAIFTQWLALTARLSGTVDDILDLFDQTRKHGASTGRLKGKARKQLNNNTKSTTKSKPHAVPLKHFKALAMAISEAADISVSEHVYTILRSAILDRQAYGKWHNHNVIPRHPGCPQKETTHEHFVSVLEEVLAILAPKELPVAVHGLGIREQEGTREKQEWSIAFEMIQEEVAGLKARTEQNAKLDNSTSQGLPQNTGPLYVMEEPDSEIMVAITNFLRHATCFRAYSQHVWHEFRDGTIGLHVAGQTMNAAISMIRKLSDEFVAAYPQFSGSEAAPMHNKVVNFMKALFPCEHCRKYCSRGPAFLEGEQGQEILGGNFGPYLIHPNVLMCTELVDFLDQVLNAPAQQPRIALYPHEENFRLMMGALYHAPKEFHSSSDLVQEAIWGIRQSNRKDTWMVFALQMAWDSQHALGDHTASAVMILRKSVLEVILGYTSCLDAMDARHAGRARSMQRESYDRLMKLLKKCRVIEKYTREDALKPMREASLPSDKVMMDAMFAFSLHINPGLCATTVTAIRDRYECTMLGIANDQGSIIAAAHLYNSMRDARRTPTVSEWQDMQWFIEQQLRQGEMIVAEPRENVPFFDDFMTARGVSPADLAKINKKRYLKFNDCVKLFNTDNSRILRSLTLTTRLCRDRTTGHIDVLEFYKHIVKDDACDPDAKPDLLGTVDFFKQILRSDELGSIFNVAQFHLQCVQFLRIALSEDLPAFNEMNLEPLVEHFIALRGTPYAAPANICFGAELVEFLEMKGHVTHSSACKHVEALEERVWMENIWDFHIAQLTCSCKLSLQDRIVLPGETEFDVFERINAKWETAEREAQDHDCE